MLTGIYVKLADRQFRVILPERKIEYIMAMNKTKIIALAVVCLFASTVTVFARGASDSVSPAEIKKVDVSLIVPSGATLATIAHLDTNEIDEGYNVETEVIKSSDLIAGRLISGEADFAVIPTNLAAVLANKGTGLRMAGPAIWGLLYIVTSEDLDGIQDLKGRTVHMIGRGLTPDITFRHLLEENDLEPDVDVTITYASSAAELAPAFLSGKSTVSMMPEPMITTVLTRKPDTRILVDVQQEWAARYGSSYPQAGLVVSGAFADEHPAFVEAFVNAYSAAVAAAVADPEATGVAVNELASEMNPDIFAAAIPRMNLEFVDALDAKDALEDYYRVLEAFNPATIGGKLPSDDFYLR